MEIKIYERILLSTLLPKQGNYLELLQIKSVSEKIELKKEEIEKREIKFNDWAFTGKDWWIDEVIEIEFDKSEFQTIKTALKKLDEEKKLWMDTMSLYEKFCQ